MGFFDSMTKAANSMAKSVEQREKEILRAAERKVKTMSDQQLKDRLNGYVDVDPRVIPMIERELRRRGY